MPYVNSEHSRAWRDNANESGQPPAPFHAMATLADLQAELADVRSAIKNVLMAGQSSGFGGRNTARAQLATLIDMRNDLERRIARVDGSRPLMVSGRVTGLGCQVGS